MPQSLFSPLFSLLTAIDLLYGGIYCFVCQDYIYDKDMEQIAKEEQRKAWKLQGIAFCIFWPRTRCIFWNKAIWRLSGVTFMSFCIHRHRGEIHNMGADQEGARTITTQSKAEENHYKLYHRWAMDCTVQSAHLNQPRFSSLDRCVCVCVCVHAPMAQVHWGSFMHLCVIPRINRTGSPHRQCIWGQDTGFPLW